MEQSDRILKGLPVGPVPDCSLMQYLLPRMRSHPKDELAQVDAETGKTQTWGQLVSSCIRLAEGLRQIGVNESDVVATMCGHCLEAAEVVLATWMTGAAIAPINGFMTVYELKNILNITKPKVIFCEEEMVENIRSALDLLSLKSRIVLATKSNVSTLPYPELNEIRSDVDVSSYEALPVVSPSTQLAAIIPSSGTSGLSKGVGLTHKNFVFECMKMEAITTFTERNAALQISNFFWVTGLITLLCSAFRGIKRIFTKDTSVKNIFRVIERYKTEWILIGPLYGLHFVSSPDFDQYDISSLKTVLIGGSIFSKSTAEKLKSKLKHANFIQLYGMTETTGIVSSTVEGGDVLSLGKIAPGIELKISDVQTGETLGTNAVGEICVKTLGLMRGYVGNEKATKECVDDSGWFHTGDLGYYDSSGQLYFVDRIKELLKVMNMQVAPTEIEDVIMSVPGVLEAGVSGAGFDNIDNSYIVALVVRSSSAGVTEKDILLKVQNTLSEYKQLTGGVYFVEFLPKTASGKIQRRELQKMGQSLFLEAKKGSPLK